MPTQTKLNLKIQPGAKKNEVVGEMDGAIKIKIAAPPIEGKANKELVAYLAKKLGVRKKAIAIESGETGRRKTVSIEGIDTEKAKRLLLNND